jgi:hypothetical protein
MINHLKRYPLTEEALSSRANLVKWCIDLHNIVNYYNGKPMLSYGEAMTQIESYANPKQTNPLYYLVIIIAVFIIGYLIYYYYHNK